MNWVTELRMVNFYLLREQLYFNQPVFDEIF